jgi:hypothetical protein
MPKFSELQSIIWRYAQRSGPSTLNSGIIAAWPLDDSGTGDRFDYSGNEYDLTNINGCSSILGEIGTYMIESSDQYLEIEYADATGLWQDDEDEISISASFKIFEWPVTNTANMPVLSLWNSNTNHAGVAIYPICEVCDVPRAIIVHASDDGVGADANRIDGPVAQLDIWYHVLFRYDGSFLRLSVNGEDSTPVAHSTGIHRSTTVPWTVGRYIPPNGIPIYADILIKNVNIWNRSLSDSEVAEWYNSGEPKAIPFI